MEFPTVATRPRNVDWKRAAALLYGDWGTSKAYVPGIAFAIAGTHLGSSYSSVWIILPVSLLTALVGINYIWICKYFPEGGGVYSSAKAHSKYLALIGGFLLVADYVVTASLSCFEAFVYLNFSYEDSKRWAILTIFVIGVINFFGPRHSGTLAVGFALATVVVVGLLAVASIPQLPDAVVNVQRPVGGAWSLWVAFTGAVLALSGVEAIANMTGVMQLDPGSTRARPSVTVTSRKALVTVMAEVVSLTALFGLAMSAIPNMGPKDHEGDMLRHMAQMFVDEPAKQVGWLSWVATQNPFSWIVGVVLGGLLLSATNTAIVALVSVLYLMAKDGELPKLFGMLNRFGVPWIMMLIAMLAPILVIDVQGTEDAVHGLASLYAVGVVGAIAVNLWSCAFNYRLPMLRYERVTMILTFFVMGAIWVTIAITKPFALLFAVTVLGLGFTARALHKGFPIHLPEPLLRMTERLFPEAVAKRRAALNAEAMVEQLQKRLGVRRPVTAIMVAARGVTPTLRFAVEQARVNRAQLFVLFIREQHTSIPVPLVEAEDEEAQEVFNAAKSIAGDVNVTTIYAVSDDPAWTILDNAAIAGVDMLILGHSRRSALTRMLRGDLLERLAAQLPEEIQLVIVN
ncbi:MAG: universal stress protein [Verrucomicrobiae bacterium]|nr:universal stress protein [Verrucomicrobiae bacterium]MDW8343993.1 universal stress protein [Verrucomicrobiae bacterium]